MHLLSFDLIIRRLGITLALAIILTGVVGLISEEVAAVLFLPSWVVLFFGWPYLSRRLNFNFPKPPASRQSRPPIGKRLVITAVVALGLAYALALSVNADVFGLTFLVFWLVLFFGWPYLRRRLSFLNFPTEGTRNARPKRPLWLRLIRSTLTVGGGVGLAILLVASIVVVPLSLSHRRAQRVRDSVHLGMTVPEVLRVARDCDIFQASSDFPYDEKADGDNIPAMNLGRSKDGTYWTYELAARRDVPLSEAEAIQRLHAKLHDGYNWHFHYTYINLTPQHVSFSVVFGPDGRVTEVKPVYGWD